MNEETHTTGLINPTTDHHTHPQVSIRTSPPPQRSNGYGSKNLTDRPLPRRDARVVDERDDGRRDRRGGGGAEDEGERAVDADHVVCASLTYAYECESGNRRATEVCGVRSLGGSPVGG